MRARVLYTGLSLIGAIVPLFHFWRFLTEHGLAPTVFLDQLFGTPVSAFFGWDVIIAAAVLLVFVVREGSGKRVPHLWAPVLGTLLVGVSFGLPLFLALREGQITSGGSANPSLS